MFLFSPIHIIVHFKYMHQFYISLWFLYQMSKLTWCNWGRILWPFPRRTFQSSTCRPNNPTPLSSLPIFRPASDIRDRILHRTTCISDTGSRLQRFRSLTDLDTWERRPRDRISGDRNRRSKLLFAKLFRRSNVSVADLQNCSWDRKDHRALLGHYFRAFSPT